MSKNPGEIKSLSPADMNSFAAIPSNNKNIFNKANTINIVNEEPKESCWSNCCKIFGKTTVAVAETLAEDAAHLVIKLIDGTITAQIRGTNLLSEAQKIAIYTVVHNSMKLLDNAVPGGPETHQAIVQVSDHEVAATGNVQLALDQV